MDCEGGNRCFILFDEEAGENCGINKCYNATMNCILRKLGGGFADGRLYDFFAVSGS